MITSDYVTFRVIRHNIRFLVVLAVIEDLYTTTDDHIDLIGIWIDEFLLFYQVR